MENEGSRIPPSDVESMPNKPQIPVDFTSRLVGDFGRWQLWISLLLTMLKLPIAWYQLNIIFMAPPQDFWCVKPDSFKYSIEEWRKTCAPLTQCVMMWGVLIGGIIFGVLADKYGRKTPLMVGIITQSVCSFIASFLQSYWWFLLNWFILAMASGGVGIISFVICMEIVGGKYRTIIPVMFQLPFGLGTALMAGLAYWLRDWRKLEFALASLSALYIFYWLAIPESPRWLLATGQTEKALEVLKRGAKFNNIDFNPNEVRAMFPKSSAQKRKDPGFMAFFRSKNMRRKTMLLSVNWFCTGLSFYTFSQYLGEIGNNIFLTVSLTGTISVLGGIVCILIIAKMGRKKTIGVFQLTTALCFVMLLAIPKDLFVNDWPRLLCAGIGFAGMAGYLPALYLFSGELFPTMGRNAGISGVTMFARIASMIAPAVVSLDSVVPGLPLILLAATSIGQIFLLMPLPETKDHPLPDTLEQAELF